MRKILFLIFFLSLFSIFTVSATAVINQIPVWNVNTLQSAALNLNNYCYSNSSNFGCASNSYAVQFIDPDTNQIVYLFSGGTSSNSYFSITMGTNGNLILQTQNKIISGVFLVVYASDVPLTSQVKSGFTLNINSYTKPLQIGSLKTLAITGNGTVSFPMSNLFMNYNAINVIYSDPVLAQSISITGTLTQQSCTASSNGAVYVCVVPNSNSVSLQIKGKNIAYLQSFYITAINNFGATAFSNAVSVIVTPTVLNTSATILPPFRNPLSVGPINIGFNDVGALDLNQLWTNYTYIKAEFANPASPSSNITLQLGVINYTVYNTASYVSSYYSVYLNSLTYPEVHLQVNSNVTNTSFPIYLTACNNGGCDSNNSVEWVNIQGQPPVAAPLSVGGILMGYNEVKNYDLKTLYSGQDRFGVMFTDPNFIPNDFATSEFYNWSNIVLSGSSYDVGTITVGGGNFSAQYYYTADIVVNSGTLSIDNGAVILPAGTYSGYVINSTVGLDTNFTATGDTTINILHLWISQLNATLINSYDDYPSTITSYNTSGVFITSVANSTVTTTLSAYVGTPAFFPVLYEHGILSITSGSQDVNLTLYPYACNSAGCTSGNLLNGQFSIPLIITSNPFPEYNQIKSGFWQNSANFFRGLFPAANTVSSTKGLLIPIFAALISNIFILLISTGLFTNPDGVKGGLILSAVIDVVLFIFASAMGYVPVIVWVTIIAIALLVIVISAVRGKNNG